MNAPQIIVICVFAMRAIFPLALWSIIGTDGYQVYRRKSVCSSIGEAYVRRLLGDGALVGLMVWGGFF